ncbi:MAG: DUF1552 domain-containing protein [Verrucomicrobiota bacterium]
MNLPYLTRSRLLKRRTFLRASGACLALPWLESLNAATSAPKNRLIAICTDLGMVPDQFFPKTSGFDYQDSLYTMVLSKHRGDMTVFSGLSHPECVGGHQTDKCFLTGAIHPRKPGFKNTISIDQYAADQLGAATRFPSLALRVGPGGGSLSYSASGVRVPAEGSPSRIYQQLFVQGTPEEIEAQVSRLKDGRSLMDSFTERVKTLEGRVGYEDKERLDQFFTAFREMEKRLEDNQEWAQKPKPHVEAKPPKDVRTPEALIQRTRLIYDLAHLAVQTDSTRLITIFVTQQFNPKVDLPGVDLPHHALTHQHAVKDSLTQLTIVEKAQFEELNRLLSLLKNSPEGQEDLLRRTMVLYGTNIGNANNHSNANLPTILAGGAFKHGQHLNCDRDGETPLSNLYLSMLQQLGIQTDRFSTSSGPLRGLEALS